MKARKIVIVDGQDIREIKARLPFGLRCRCCESIRIAVGVMVGRKGTLRVIDGIGRLLTIQSLTPGVIHPYQLKTVLPGTTCRDVTLFYQVSTAPLLNEVKSTNRKETPRPEDVQRVSISAEHESV
jgi:hypothetical protein